MPVQKSTLNKIGNISTDVALGRVRANIAALQKQYVVHILSVSVALRIQYAMLLRHIVICDLPRSTIFFFHII
jgi:hypothetical protein